MSIKTQERRCSSICASFVELREDGFAVTSAQAIKQKHIRHLVSRWIAEGQSAGTIENKLTHMRTLCEWMRKDGVVLALDQYVDKDAHGLRRAYVARVDKSWDGNGVSAKDVISRISQVHPHVGVQLKLQAAFGLRVEESFMFKVHRAIKDLETLRITDGTKGGRPRDVPILLRLSVLEEAAQLANAFTGTTMPPDKTLAQWRNHYNDVMKKFGVTKRGIGVTSHGLRHQFLQEYYKQLSGEDAPIKGGDRPDEETYRSTLQQVVEAAGHSRASKSGAYLSTHAAMAAQQRIRVSPAAAQSVLDEEGGNVSRAAKKLGISRQALYRALAKATTSGQIIGGASSN
ncbi:Fis family transcriptional regulator (plasmid) [Pararobbsia alpina]